MFPTLVTRRFFQSRGVRAGALLSLATIVLLVAFIMQSLPASLFSDEGIVTVVVVGCFMVMLCISVAGATARTSDVILLQRRVAFFLWWFLLISEAVFDHMGDTIRSFEGSFSPEAYGEGVIWALSFAAVLILSLGRPAYLRQLFRSSNKWLSLFALVCLMSVGYSLAQLYALAWAFKLVLVVLLLQLCRSTIDDVEGVIAFLRVTMWAFLVLSAAPLVAAIASPETAFVNGRLADPTFLSPIAACLMLLALLLNSLESRLSYGFAGAFGAFVMILAFGKAGIVAGILSALLFLIMLRKLRLGFILILGMAVLAFIVVSFTQVASYVHFYAGTSQVVTLTGRTDVWAAAIPEMRQKLLLGHGYLASYFAWAFAKNRLSTAGHLHNGFLEVIYNNGIIGLLPLVAFFWVTAKNLVVALRSVWQVRRNTTLHVRQLYLLTLGCSAIFVNLFLNGLFEASFGARAVSLFMLLIAIFILSEILVQFTSRFAVKGTRDVPGPVIEAVVSGIPIPETNS
ncbi:MAG TPA: O-antigen ligase family protein [Terriglobales bacterium]|nr:O-antigen ligase family protein [Terriglobales bacterium]